MSEDVRRALAIDATSTIADRTIDTTTTGRRTGRHRHTEIVFHRLCDDIHPSGIPAEKPRDRLVELAANPDLVFHLEHDVVADLPATATARRRTVGSRARRTGRAQPLARGGRPFGRSRRATEKIGG